VCNSCQSFKLFVLFCVLGYIGIVQHKEHSPEVLSIPPGTSCIYENLKHFQHFGYVLLFLKIGSRINLRNITTLLHISLMMPFRVATCCHIKKYQTVVANGSYFYLLTYELDCFARSSVMVRPYRTRVNTLKQWMIYLTATT